MIFLEYVDRLQQVDTENVAPTAHVLPVQKCIFVKM